MDTDDQGRMTRLPDQLGVGQARGIVATGPVAAVARLGNNMEEDGGRMDGWIQGGKGMDWERLSSAAHVCLSLCVFLTKLVFIRQKRQKRNHSMKIYGGVLL